MSLLYIPVGIPGCGKSTMFRRLHKPGLVCVSTDKVCEDLGYPSGSTDPNVFTTYHNEIRARLIAGSSVYADATNLRVFAREDLAGIAQDVGVDTHLILFRNMSEAVLRNGRRTGNTPGQMPVPPDVMLRMIEQYERALKDIEDETYDFVTEVSSVR